MLGEMQEQISMIYLRIRKSKLLEVNASGGNYITWWTEDRVGG